MMIGDQSAQIASSPDSRHDSPTTLLPDNTSPFENEETKDTKYPSARLREVDSAQPSANSSQTDVTLNDPDETQSTKTRRPWWTFRQRWREIKNPRPSQKRKTPIEGEEWIKGVSFAMRWAALVLVINVILAIIAIALGYSGFSSRNDRSTVSTAIYDGKCSVSGGWASGLHALINILSTGLLAASNYAMQSLSAPSREDIDAAHSKGKWLDIGTFSYRNIFAMDSKRKLTWLVLLLTSVPIHLMYNSVVFSSMATNLYGIVLIPDDLGKGEMIFNTNYTAEKMTKTLGYSAQDLQAEIFNGTMKNLTLEECVDAYAVEYNTHRTTVVLVADREHFNNQSSLQAYYEMSSQDYYGYSSYRYSWMCAQERPTSCTKKDVMGLVDRGEWSIWAEYWEYRNWTFSYPTSREANRTFACDYNLRHDFSDDKSSSLRKDVQTLCNYVRAYNPSDTQLGQYMSSTSHWEDSRWAAQVSFQWQNYTDSITGFDYARSKPSLEIPVSHCMSKESEEKCQLLFSLPICLVVIMCNIVKLVAIYMAANTKRKRIFLTVGDAIASFLTSPDPTTKHLSGRISVGSETESQARGKRPYFYRLLGWVSPRQQCHHNADPTAHSGMNLLPTTADIDRSLVPKRKMSKSKRWYQAASSRRWAVLFFIIVSSYITAIVLFYVGSGQRYQNKVTLQTSWQTGFGKPSSVAMIGKAAQNVMQAVLLSNTPQLVLSILYFLSNSILTNMVVAAEYNEYAIHRKPLRVSWPKGHQRSTRYLSLPYRYRIPFIILAVALHWLVSQSLFFTRVRLFDIDGTLVERWSTTRCGYSLVAILTTLIVGAIATLSLVGLGLRKYKSNMPLPVYSSVEISAACHPPEDDRDAALKPVMWGVVPDDGVSDTGIEDAKSQSYTFTSKDVLC